MAKIWFVEFPTFQYKEDVVELARKNGLEIVDKKYDNGNGETKVPKLTKKGKGE